MFKRVLIANRGEIAIRIARAAASLGVDSVAIFTRPDSLSLHTKLAGSAHEIGGDRFVDMLVEDTHTCYLGDRSHRHDWGYGCGQCPACRLRADGFARWKSAR